jgi:sortase A
MTPRLQFRWLQRAFLVLGILLLMLWSGTSLDSHAFQFVQSQAFEAALRAAEAGPPGATLRNAAIQDPSESDPARDATAPEAVLGRIVIPRLRITAMVAEGVDSRTLGRAVGHVPSTALPGSPGNCGLAGHRDTFLRGLGDVRVDDVIRIVTLEGTYRYQVEWTKVVEPERVDVLDSTATRSLTLVTCYPFAYVGRAPQRFVVRARQLDTVADSTAVGDLGALRPQGLTAKER